jgi:hypothetical protein
METGAEEAGGVVTVTLTVHPLLLPATYVRAAAGRSCGSLIRCDQANSVQSSSGTGDTHPQAAYPACLPAGVRQNILHCSLENRCSIWSHTFCTTIHATPTLRSFVLGRCARDSNSAYGVVLYTTPYAPVTYRKGFGAAGSVGAWVDMVAHTSSQLHIFSPAGVQF